MVTTRHAVPADEDAVLDLWRRAGGPTRLAPSATALRRLAERDPEALLIAEVDGPRRRRQPLVPTPVRRQP